MKNEIPGLVRAQVQVHLSETVMKLERVRAELDRTTVSTARSRVLRGLRDQLTAQRDAWEYLVTMVESEHYQACSEVNDVPANVIAYRGDNPESWWCREHQPAVYFTGEVTDRDEIEEGAECFQCGRSLVQGTLRPEPEHDTPVPESDPDTECVCTHPRHAHNPQGLCVMIPGVTGCGCLGFLGRREYRG